MVGFYFLLVIFSFQGSVSCQGQIPPSRRNSALPREDVRECYEDLVKDGDISHLLLDVTSPEKIDQFCGRTSKLKQCIARNEHQLSNEENTKYLRRTRGISAFYLNVCPPGTDITRKYKGNSPCFQLIKNKILSCGSDLPDMSSYEMQNDRKARCCALTRHRKCVLEATGQICGKPAAEVMDQILIRYFRHELDGCQDIHGACANEDSKTRFIGSKPENPDEDYETRTDGLDDDYTTTDNYEWDEHDHNAAVRDYNAAKFVSSLLVVLLQIVLMK